MTVRLMSKSKQVSHRELVREARRIAAKNHLHLDEADSMFGRRTPLFSMHATGWEKPSGAPAVRRMQAMKSHTGRRFH